MNWDEYNILFHKCNLNLVAFKRLMDCDQEVLKLVNAAIETHRPWVGLTDEERDYFTYIDAKDKARFHKYSDYIEQALKEKNK
jgi:hypothetical protein